VRARGRMGGMDLMSLKTLSHMEAFASKMLALSSSLLGL
jgi:hypothetical protein